MHCLVGRREWTKPVSAVHPNESSASPSRCRSDRMGARPIRKPFDAGGKLTVDPDGAIVFRVDVPVEFPRSVADSSLNTCCEIWWVHLAVPCRPKGGPARA
jgi:hypothetical protein